MISTRNLAHLPNVDALRKLLQSMALLDAILCPDWDGRYYSFNSVWSEGEQMGSMRDGCGDDFFALFNQHGCFLKGFAHEAEMSPWSSDPPQVWPGVLEGVPSEFDSGLKEVAFKMDETTFCLWRRWEDRAWRHGPIQWPAGPEGADPDGSAELLSPLDGQPETYREWAEEYYEQDVDLEVVRHVYAHLPLTEELIARLNPEVTLVTLAEDLQEIGYPQ